ncbi:hypothetical protein ACFQL4_23365 [Halosimplex aquaticum]
MEHGHPDGAADGAGRAVRLGPAGRARSVARPRERDVGRRAGVGGGESAIPVVCQRPRGRRRDAAVALSRPPPVLGQTGAVTFDPESGLVAAANEPPFDEAWVGRLVTDHPDREYDSSSTRSRARRQAVLYELFIGESATVDALADAVAVHERDGAEASEPVSRVVGLSLAHIHLPLLADVGLVACDPAAETVHAGETAWRSHPWVGLSPIGEWAAVE